MATKALCSVEGCGKAHYSLGYCLAHYSRFKRHGDPTGGRLARGAALAWIVSHASHDGDECLPWPFKRIRSGYGVITVDGFTTTAHRKMCVEAHGPPDSPDLQAAHSCNNRPCCNPNHLRWATPVENAADQIAAGTTNRGERQWQSKLTAEDVVAIRGLGGTMTQKAVASRYGVHPETIGYVLRGGSWGWLE